MRKGVRGAWSNPAMRMCVQTCLVHPGCAEWGGPRQTLLGMHLRAPTWVHLAGQLLCTSHSPPKQKKKRRGGHEQAVWLRWCSTLIPPLLLMASASVLSSTLLRAQQVHQLSHLACAVVVHTLTLNASSRRLRGLIIDQMRLSRIVPTA